VEWLLEDEANKMSVVPIDYIKDGRLRAAPTHMFRGADTDVKWKSQYFLARILFDGKT